MIMNTFGFAPSQSSYMLVFVMGCNSGRVGTLHCRGRVSKGARRVCVQFRDSATPETGPVPLEGRSDCQPLGLKA
jgi:hypothetical protein